MCKKSNILSHSSTETPAPTLIKYSCFLAFMLNGMLFIQYGCKCLIWLNKRCGLDAWHALSLSCCHLNYSAPNKICILVKCVAFVFESEIAGRLLPPCFQTDRILCAIAAICVLNRIKLHLYLYFRIFV